MYIHIGGPIVSLEKCFASKIVAWKLSRQELKILNVELNVEQIENDSNGRRPQNIKCRISQQPLIGSYSNLKLKLL